MNYIFSILAGVIQGLTEFLPISSSGHLILIHDFFNFQLKDNLSFDVALHLATLIALILFFWQDALKYLKAFFQSLIKWDVKNDINQRLAWFIFIATIPAALIGYFLEDEIESVFRNSLLVAVMLIVFALFLALADKFCQKIRDYSQLTFFGALFIGISQALALVPGVSRSGITIIAGLSQKLKRESAARFSFLLSIPILFGAGVKKILDLSLLNFENPLVLLLGFLAATITGYFCIKYFLKFLQNHSLQVFVLYRIILGIIVLVIYYFINKI